MKKIFFIFALIFVGLSPNEAFAENYKGYKYVDMGYIYSDLTVPASVSKEINRKEHKKADYENLKKGVSSSINILKLIEIGNAGIESAAKAGNIKKIAFIDANEMTVFFFFRRITTTVYGE